MAEQEAVPIDLAARVEAACPMCRQMFMLDDPSWSIEVVGGTHVMQKHEGGTVTIEKRFGPCNSGGA